MYTHTHNFSLPPPLPLLSASLSSMSFFVNKGTLGLEAGDALNAQVKAPVSL